MLDSETKRRIDNARDILVGKVPDPKTQVEQITFAMIYKFMDDMDQLSVELGGKSSFFANGYEQFAWSKLMDKKMGGEARLDLYVRALEQMAQNPHIPQLFRDIFKGAFLPYRDSETLNLFLKEINGFSYTHSEDLGDAYEYLLAIFASQGKAGQFRTPRHIIDFIVDCVDPGKDDTVLDPACGTAGFLVSAYKHILESHKDNPLTPDQKQRLTGNFVGYDISPDMVRLSRVNMYLHQFPNPTIHEYDTLTTEDRWDDNFDVILANPPFMSPSGGIRPHKRFAVRANRSEVLFVDYIAEHLNLGGRAGVIVPEGIIFQSSNAYKALRKMLVEENYLVAVVSLPAGVFNPYSGVKTSVLLLDKALARQSESVLFLKVAADGYGLGAQRREIERNDLPEALRVVKAFQADPAAALPEGDMAQTVKKGRLAEGGDYNLSAERYRANGVVRSKWPMVRLGEILSLEYGKPLKEANRKGGEYPVYGSNGIVGWHSDFLVEGPFIIVGRKGSAGEVTFSEKSGYPIDTTFFVKLLDNQKTELKFIYRLLKYVNLGNVNTQSGVPGLNRNDAYQIEVPLPPLEVQREIMEEIEGYQKVIDGARQVVENYKPVIPIDPTWPLVKLGDICENLDFMRKPVAKAKRKLGIYPYYGASGIVDYVDSYIFDGNYLLISEDGANLLARVTPIAFSITGKTWVNNHAHILKFENCMVQDFVMNYINMIDISYYVSGSAQPKLNQENLNKIKIPYPDLSIQENVVKELQLESQMVKSSSHMIKHFEAKIADRIQRVWKGAS
jgi:type I restriction enzyme M protein